MAELLIERFVPFFWALKDDLVFYGHFFLLLHYFSLLDRVFAKDVCLKKQGSLWPDSARIDCNDTNFTVENAFLDDLAGR